MSGDAGRLVEVKSIEVWSVEVWSEVAWGKEMGRETREYIGNGAKELVSRAGQL